MTWTTVNEPELTMPTLSLEWLKHILERCITWHDGALAITGLEDPRLADELIDFGESTC